MPKTKSFVWNHFEKLHDKATKCKICNAILAYHDSPGSMSNHLTHKHPTVSRSTTSQKSNSPRDSTASRSTTSQKSLIPHHFIMPKAKSFVWNHFEKLNDKETKCKICNTILAYHHSTGSMISHINFKHPNVSRSTTGPRSHQDKMPTSMRKETGSPPRSSKITKLIASMIGEVNLPISMVEEPSFRELLRYIEPEYTAPSQKSMTSQLRLLYDTKKANIKADLTNAASVAVTIDSWTSRTQEGYMTLTAHMVDEQWQSHALVLETSPVVAVDDEGSTIPDRHIKVMLADQLRRVVEDWGLLEKVSAVVHDNGTNMKDIGMDALLVIDVGCAAHTLQLAVNRGIESSFQISTMIRAANRLVCHFKHSAIAAKALEMKQDSKGQQKKKLVSSVATRWNSVLDMLERLIEVRWSISCVLSDRNVTTLAEATDLEMTANQWSLAETFIPCLKPLKVAAAVLSAEENLSCSVVHPIISGLLQNHLVVNMDDGEVIRNFKDMTRDQLESLFRQPDYHVRTAAMGAAVDPRYKDLNFLHLADKEKIRTELLRCLEALQEVRDNAEPDVDDEDAADPELGIDFLMGTTAGPARERSADEEYDEFLSQMPVQLTVNPLTWWQGNYGRFPLLQQLARKYLAIPATSVPSERVFSAAGSIVTAKRSCLLPENLDMLIFLSENK
ncbi:zinc finger BED domain-containing protein 1 isoform X2 [Strongylocentrotus purpuratus]|uniref:BED-type domain-containing protein n=1 Tax=Strongylocentrotus purpuratus TaxID=7668 RepID=A0A7M7HIV0_STRPU|nr:zinc finger BED domain-containing protein 1 isoform X2 [Strongylocentrotus purpuratus]|eukprot:XP_011668672.1 PREDICTED: zinc finger BED domain-containing protein 1-like isoform X2 [Strongylocentrotus purpuratus]